MAYPIHGRFFSLRWRLVLLFALLLALGYAAVLWLIGSERHAQFLQVRSEQQHRELTQQYAQQLRYTEQQIQLQLARLGLTPTANFSKVELYQRLPQLWQRFSNQNGQGLALYRAEPDATSLRLLSGYGQSATVEHAWLQQSLQSRQDRYDVHCQTRCDLLFAQPLQIDGHPHILLLFVDLITVLSPLYQAPQQAFALIAATEPLPDQALTFYGFSPSAQSPLEPLLVRIEQPWLSSQQQHHQGQDWQLHSWPIDDRGTALVLGESLPDWTLLNKQFALKLALLFTLNMGILIGLMALATRRSLWQIQQIKTALPLLACSRFDEFRQQIFAPSGLFYDESDQLQKRSLDVAKQLEQQGCNIKSYTQALQREVMLDLLTGLPGRAMFMYELTKTLASIGRINEQIAVLLIDLDEFTRNNDTLGHEIGDELLKVMASRLQSSVRTMDSVCRLGNDEFAVLIRGLAPDADIHRVNHQLFHRLQQPIQLGHHRLIITVSIGVAFCDNPRIKADELVKMADLALDQAKLAGRSNYRVFDEQMRENVSRRLLLEQELNCALQHQQLRLAMLPVVGLSEQKIIGFEALIRWHHPARGLVMPAEFVHEVDGSEAGMQLGHYVLEQAIKALVRFSKQLDNHQFYISVNLSPQQYLQAGSERLQALLAYYRVEPKRVILELTEESLIKDLESAQAMMKQLKQIGVQIAIDDFGTGYSSLSYLKQLPFDQLKVDRGFVAGLDHSDVDQKIVTNVIELAHNLSRKVVAEGVESHDQHQFLLQIGCDYAQGYWFCTPLEPEQLQGLFAKLDPQLHWPERQLNVAIKTQQSR